MAARRGYQQNVPNKDLIVDFKPQYFLCELVLFAINELSKEEVDWNSYWFIMRAQTFKWLFLKTLKSADSPFWRSPVDISYSTITLV